MFGVHLAISGEETASTVATRLTEPLVLRDIIVAVACSPDGMRRREYMRRDWDGKDTLDYNQHPRRVRRCGGVLGACAPFRANAR